MRAEKLEAALRLVMACAGDIQAASDAELENALTCGDPDTEKQANAWLVARDALEQQVAVPVTKTRVGNYLCRHESGDNTMFRNGFKDGVKFAEAHHGIKAKPSHTDWSAA